MDILVNKYRSNYKLLNFNHLMQIYEKNYQLFTIALEFISDQQKTSTILLKDNLVLFENKKKLLQKAITHIKVIASNESYSFIELNPITGRKHQLRKQLLNLGNPIIGDDKYFLNGIKRFKKVGLMLHAHKIKFMINNVQYNFKAKYNANFENFLKKNI